MNGKIKFMFLAVLLGKILVLISCMSHVLQSTKEDLTLAVKLLKIALTTLEHHKQI
jgi:hypothetical protein